MNIEVPVTVWTRRRVLQASLVSCGAALLPSVSSFAQKGASRLPAWRNGMPVNRFSPIPGTAPNLAVGMPPEWQKQVINDYCGLQTDETRGVVYSSLAGGHATTLQNGVYKIDIMQGTPRWSVVRASSNVSSRPIDMFYLPDGRPASRHTYYAGHVVDIAGSPVIIHVCMMGGQSSAGSMNSMQTDAFHIDRNDWDPAGTWPNMPGEIGSIFPKCAAKDPRTQFIWAIDGSRGGLISYLNPVTRKWTPVNGNLNNWGASGASLVDKIHNRFVISGSASYVANPGTPQAVHDTVALGTMNLSTYVYQDMGLSGTGKPSLSFAGEPGFVHDTINDRYLFIEGATGRVTTMHPVTGDCTLLTTTLPAAIGHVENRFAFIPALKGVVYLPSWADTLYFMPVA